MANKPIPGPIKLAVDEGMQGDIEATRLSIFQRYSKERRKVLLVAALCGSFHEQLKRLPADHQFRIETEKMLALIEDAIG